MNTTYPWQQMLDDFRQLGGTAENIEQRAGQYGNGLFPVDPAQPIQIVIPDRLLLDSDQLVLDGEDLVVAAEANVPAEIRDFIARYQKHFSWGADGRRQVESFETALKTLPEPLLERLHHLRLLNLSVRHKGPWDEILRRHFLQSRSINYRERKVSMPIIELINHAPKSPGYLINDGIQFKGSFTDEVSVNYSPTSDALLRFFHYGFACPEPQAYSLPMHLKLGEAGTLHVGLNLLGVEIKDKLPLPKLEIDGKRHKLAHLRLGMERSPRLPRTLLRKALPMLSATEADEVFERIRSANQQALCGLMELADGANTPIVREFRSAVLCQLKALSYCFGVRPNAASSTA